MSNAQSDTPKKDPIRHAQHELRTPLNHILGFSELLIEEVRSTDLEGLTPGLKKIYDAGKFILTRLTETFATIGGSNWTAQLDSLHEDIHNYTQQISLDSKQVKEQALALG